MDNNKLSEKFLRWRAKKLGTRITIATRLGQFTIEYKAKKELKAVKAELRLLQKEK